MATSTFIAQSNMTDPPTFISFYKEMPGGWKLDFRDRSGEYIPNGDSWVENLDDLVFQISCFTSEDLIWKIEGDGKSVSFYEAVRSCISESMKAL